MGNKSDIGNYIYNEIDKKELLDKMNEKIKKFYDEQPEIEEEKNKKYSSYLRMLKYYEHLKKIEYSEEDKELKTKKIRRKVISLMEKYKNVNLEEKEIEVYKNAGCNTREDVIKLEILYIKDNLIRNQSVFDFEVAKTISKLKMLEKSLDEEELSSERYKSIKKYLVITEIVNDLDVSLISVLEDLYSEYVENNDKKRTLK